MEVCNTVQEAMSKTIPRKKKYQKAKWLSEEALQITETRREVKSKGKRERYTQLKAESQRTARRDKKAFLNEQYKETDEINRMGMTRSLQENWRHQGNISCKDGHDKGEKLSGPSRNRRD